MLGIMYSGAAYVPIDPAYPAARVHYTLNNSSSRLVVSNTSLLPQYQAEIQPHVELCHIFLIDEFIENPVR
jgi:non-ribosomal peptide synthetase component F